MSVRDTLLLVDDDREVLTIHRKFLKGKGYQVRTAGTAKDAFAVLRREPVSCIVLDVMMPGMDGFEALPKLRSLTKAPVLFMTGRTADEDRIKGLMLGADDYIIKPCSMEELALRIAINIRKSRISTENCDILEIPPLKIELTTHSAYFNEEKITLSNREYELLLLFARHPDEVLTFEEIGTALNGSYLEGDRRTVMVNTSRLRKRLEPYPRMADRIETVWGKGYRLLS